MAIVQRIVPCLWFGGQAEEAARFYVSIFPNSRIGTITRHGEQGIELHRQTPGSVMSVTFYLDGQEFLALNGGPMFKFTEAVSLIVQCETQAELDHYWNALTDGGDPEAQQCGWLKDRYGLSWQVVPVGLVEMLADGDTARTGRVMEALLGMKKLDLAALRRAYEAA
ncbi:MAG: VOC family protein [Rhodospirillaceae bacterium]|nr:VOC family protein [Rhodospirillaceae bacterium]